MARVRAVLALVDAGVQDSDAVARLSDPQEDAACTADELRGALWRAVDGFDERATTAVPSTAVLGIPAALTR